MRLKKKFKMKIYKLAEDTIDNADYSAMIKFLQNRNYLNQSIITKKFEKKFSFFLKKKYSVFVNSGSSANLLIALALIEGEFLKNKTVVLPAVSWATTVSPFLQLGYKVILCDCDKNNLGLSISNLEEVCKKFKPGLVMVVNVLGHSNNFSQIKHMQEKYKFKLIEDNCESMGSFSSKQNLGTFGLASSHSFYYGHHISTIEGGMVSTNDKKLYNILLAIRSHGWARDVQNLFRKKLEKKYNVDEFKSLYTFYYSGLNIRSTDFNANLGLEQLKKIKKISKLRFRNFKIYEKNLGDYWSQKSNLKLVSNFGYATFVENRYEVFKYLKLKKIQIRPLICGNMAQQPFWKKNLVKRSFELPNAEFVDKYGIYMPNHAKLTPSDIKYICDNFKSVAKPIFF